MRSSDKKSKIQKFLSRISVVCVLVLITYLAILAVVCLFRVHHGNSELDPNPKWQLKPTPRTDSLAKRTLDSLLNFSSLLKFVPLREPLSRIFAPRPIFLHENLRQKLFKFKQVTFSSHVESGSLSRVKRLKNRRFLVYISSDVVVNQENEEKRNWFNFKINNAGKAQTIKISIRNLNYNWSMWKHGLVPAVRSSTKPGYRVWVLFGLGESTLVMKKGKLQLDFEYPLDEGEEVQLALTFPYTFTRLNAFMRDFTAKVQRVSQDMFVAKETLIKSNLGNPVNIYWIGLKNSKTQKIPKLKNLFPNIPKGQSRSVPKRKCNIVVSARVHPSETASNFMLEGFLNSFLEAKTGPAKHKLLGSGSESSSTWMGRLGDKLRSWTGRPQAKRPIVLKEETEAVLRKCNLVVIPMLNPDGVISGLTRTDINGINLNNHYEQADLDTPSIYALKKYIKWLHQKKQLNFFFDLHSHFTKRGAFVFGNPLNEKNFTKILSFPYFFNQFEKEFSFQESNFGSLKSESTSRREIASITKIQKVYTIEVNYWGKKQRLARLKKKRLINFNLRKVKGGRGFYSTRDFRRIGRNFGKALLSYFESRRMPKPRREEIRRHIEKLYKRRLKAKSRKRARRSKKRNKRKQRKGKKAKAKAKAKKAVNPILAGMPDFSLVKGGKTDRDKTVIYKNISKPKTANGDKVKSVSLDELHPEDDTVQSKGKNVQTMEDGHDEDDSRGQKTVEINNEDAFSGTMSVFNNLHNSFKSSTKNEGETSEMQDLQGTVHEDKSKSSEENGSKKLGEDGLIDKDDDQMSGRQMEKSVESDAASGEKTEEENPAIINIGYQSANFGVSPGSDAGVKESNSQGRNQEKKEAGLPEIDKITVFRNQIDLINKKQMEKTETIPISDIKEKNTP